MRGRARIAIGLLVSVPYARSDTSKSNVKSTTKTLVLLHTCPLFLVHIHSCIQLPVRYPRRPARPVQISFQAVCAWILRPLYRRRSCRLSFAVEGATDSRGARAALHSPFTIHLLILVIRPSCSLYIPFNNRCCCAAHHRQPLDVPKHPIVLSLSLSSPFAPPRAVHISLSTGPSPLASRRSTIIISLYIFAISLFSLSPLGRPLVAPRLLHLLQHTLCRRRRPSWSTIHPASCI